jgi:TolB-like protein/Tfp pilus assembly protein PilF
MRDVRDRYYRFDDVTIDVGNLRVTVGSEIRPLEPKSFRLLLLLVENPGRVLSKEEIMAGVWRDTVVSDNSLARSIAQIRNALDDDPKNPKYVETVPTIGYRFLGTLEPGPQVEPKASVTAANLRAQDVPSIAVLPFVNISSDKEQDYFCDGLAEDVLNALVRCAGLRVIARTSSFAFKGQNIDVRRIAAELAVSHILEGSVRRAGDRIRVTAQLVSAEDGSQIWSERYDSKFADVFAVQDEIAQAITTALRGELGSPRRPQPYTPNLPAYERFLRALHYYAKFSRESTFHCKKYLEETLALDPKFALAHALLAECFIEFAYNSSMPACDAAPRARTAAEAALRLNPSLPEAHEVLGRIAALYDYAWDAAEREFRLAMKREPVAPRVRWRYAHACLLSAGRLEECEEELERALRDDPINGLSRFTLALCLHASGRLGQATSEFRQVLNLEPNFVPASYWLTRNLVAEGDIPGALAISESLLPQAPKNPEVVGGLAGLLMRIGARDRAERLVNQLGDGSEYGAPIGFISYYLMSGEPRKSAEWMERAIEQRHFVLPLYVRTPLARSLMDSAHGSAIAAKMGFVK